MPITIEKINDNEHVELKGDVVVLGNVGKNATVKVINGSLGITGNVGENSFFELIEEKQNSFRMGSNVFVNVFIPGENQRTLYVKGDVGAKVHFTAMSANFYVKGAIHNKCVFKTMNGDIQVGDIEADCLLSSVNGFIKGKNVGQNTTLSTINGSIKVLKATNTTRLESVIGSVYVDEKSSNPSQWGNSQNFYQTPKVESQQTNLDDPKDYFKILKMDPKTPDESFEKTLKQNYKKLAMQYHPDKPTGDEAKFKELQGAYEYLLDVSKRNAYRNLQTGLDHTRYGK